MKSFFLVINWFGKNFFKIFIIIFFSIILFVFLSIAIPVFQFFDFFIEIVESILRSMDELEKNIEDFDWEKNEDLKPKEDEV